MPKPSKLFTILARNTVSKPEGSKGCEYFSAGVTVSQDEISHLDIDSMLKSGAISEFVPGRGEPPLPPFLITHQELQTKIDNAVGEAVCKARAEWEAELAAEGGSTEDSRRAALSKMTVDELRAIAEPLTVDTHGKKKAELVEAIVAAELAAEGAGGN